MLSKHLKLCVSILDIKGDLQHQTREFVKMAKDNPKWFQEYFTNFILFQKERVKRKEITEGTIGNYHKAVK